MQHPEVFRIPGRLRKNVDCYPFCLPVNIYLLCKGTLEISGVRCGFPHTWCRTAFPTQSQWVHPLSYIFAHDTAVFSPLVWWNRASKLEVWFLFLLHHVIGMSHVDNLTRGSSQCCISGSWLAQLSCNYLSSNFDWLCIHGGWWRLPQSVSVSLQVPLHQVVEKLCALPLNCPSSHPVNGWPPPFSTLTSLRSLLCKVAELLLQRTATPPSLTPAAARAAAEIATRAGDGSRVHALLFAHISHVRFHTCLSSVSVWPRRMLWI